MAQDSNMTLQLKELKTIDLNQDRLEWSDRPWVTEYVELRDSREATADNEILSDFTRYYEIYQSDRHVGDIKVFYEDDKDIINKRAQILMVVAERNKGIGTTALGLLLQRLKGIYDAVYCIILRSNIASLKILKKHDFLIEWLDEDSLRLIREL